jgi:hypothetical protein
MMLNDNMVQWARQEIVPDDEGQIFNKKAVCSFKRYYSYNDNNMN